MANLINFKEFTNVIGYKNKNFIFSQRNAYARINMMSFKALRIDCQSQLCKERSTQKNPPSISNLISLLKNRKTD